METWFVFYSSLKQPKENQGAEYHREKFNDQTWDLMSQRCKMLSAPIPFRLIQIFTMYMYIFVKILQEHDSLLGVLFI